MTSTDEGTCLNFAERSLLDDFARRRGRMTSPSSISDRRLALEPLAIEARPQAAAPLAGSSADFGRSGRQTFLMNAPGFWGPQGRCLIRWRKPSGFFRTSASLDSKESAVTADFVSPVPFDLKRPVTATLGGQPIGQSISAGQTVQSALFNAAEALS